MADTKTKDEFSLEEDDLFEDFDIVGMCSNVQQCNPSGAVKC